MNSRKQKRAALYQQLRSATNSTSVTTTSIVVDATRYIEELKEKVQKLNQDIATLQNSDEQSSSLPMQVTVETLEKGFLINVYSEKNCPGLLVSILEAFERLGLEVLDARVSCSNNYRLEAVSEVMNYLQSYRNLR
ncbi:transcription factor bHLH61-like isoform X1 [Olea europaea subsp. europaea]|uniref:Transcription factor bHLH61-like isoform X1 n=1 Tax=Olea europaea subsp. europaea TaxID=158383 RepID=A0A8S0QFE6_OLEEU|nr:transcription factor bHLH61-like isoform X1 [Olea europaea subsp. europaea]